MARISEFEQTRSDSIEIAISADEYANLGTNPGQLRLRVGLFTENGAEFTSSYISANQSDWILDTDTGEYVHSLRDEFSNHSTDYQGIVLGSVDSNGDAIEIYAAYMIGAFEREFNFNQTADAVTATNSWVPQGTPFADISQQTVTPSSGGNDEATLRWDSPDNIDNPRVQYDSGLDDTGTAPLCFVRGAFVETWHGTVRIETLLAGDYIRTRDHGFQPLRWIGYSRIPGHVMAGDPRRYPIRVRAGALGENIPVRECYFSRQHRVFIHKTDNPGGVLIAIKDLLGQPGIDLADDWQGPVDYFHMFFDRHEIVFSDGMQSESLLMTGYSISLLGAGAKSEIMKLDPDCEKMVPAREILQGKKARRHLVNISESGLTLQNHSALA